VTRAATPLPPAAEKAEVVRQMFDRIAPRYDAVNRIITGRLDTRWRRRAVRTFTFAPGGLVLDLACGTGDFCVELERARYRAIGVDTSEGMLAKARERTSAELVRADILELPMESGSADGVTCGFALRNVVSIPRCFAEMARVLRPGGQIAVLETSEPEHALARWGHRWYVGRIVPIIGAVVGGDRAAYEYLPASTAYLPAPSPLLDIVRAAGFVGVRRDLLGFGAAQLITGRRR